MSFTRDDLLSDLHGAGKPIEQWRVGAEFELHLLSPNGHPFPYFGERGVRWLLDALAGHGYTLHYEGENPIAATRDGHWVTLEPGSQFELSGSATGELQPVHDEAKGFQELTETLLRDTGTHQVALGYTPFAAIEDVPWVPKGRYVHMRNHLAQTGALAHGMMKGTCAVQASYDFADEEDCARKVRLSTALGPLTTAMFANSPYKEGKRSGFMSYRGHIWTQTDPARSGMPDAAEHFDFERWVDYLLHVPMMFKKKGEQWLESDGQTFAEWMASDEPPTWADWELHLTSVFPEVRVKHTIEVRGADCVPLPLAMSFVALFKGLFYCNLAQEQAMGLAERFVAHGTKDERFEVACRGGLQGVVGGKTLASWADELVDLCDLALGRCAPADRPWLRPLMDQIATGKSPAGTLVERLGDTPDPATLIEACRP